MLLELVLLLSAGGCLVQSAPTDNSDNDKGQVWAVLVAGSNEYGNYRHQADVCHAYQIFRRHGVPDSNIIVMMYDDIANNPDNPNKGKIINKPGGPNVYVKVPKDYTKKEVTPENFVRILTGNKTGPGKVLESGPNDHVFINFVDHGATGLIGFPESYLYADQLNAALKTMYKKKMYKKLLFYMEACESGSMFNNLLPKNIRIFATTAANPDESSYACYWDDTVDTYLGDEYSISWMEDIDSEEHQTNMTTETLKVQYKHVVKRVKESHPSKYGQINFEKDHVTDYLGKSKGRSGQTVSNDMLKEPSPFTGSVSSRDVALHTLDRKIQKTNDIDSIRKLKQKRNTLVEGRKQIDSLIKNILKQFLRKEMLKTVESSHQPLSLEVMPCYRKLVDAFHRQCVNINKNTYALSHLYKLANLCVLEAIPEAEVLKVYSAVCTEHHRALDHVD